MTKLRLATATTIVVILACTIATIGIIVIPQLMRITSVVSTRDASVEEFKESIAVRLGVSPEWEEIERYIYCEITKLGNSREKVELDLLLIGSYQAFEEGSAPGVPPGITLYHFDEDPINWMLRGIYVEYEANRVVEVTIREGGGSLEASRDRQFECLVTPSK